MNDSEAYIQDGKLITYGADGKVNGVTTLNPQQLAKTETSEIVIGWLATNIPEGNTWTTIDEHIAMSNNNNHYNCPCWKAVAANGQSFNCGELYYNLFERNPPTQSVIDELHRLAGQPVAA